MCAESGVKVMNSAALKKKIQRLEQAHNEVKSERKYLAISIKHTEYNWSFGKPCVLWGHRRTEDIEDRCFAGYTEDIHSAELYSIKEFLDKYGSEICCPYPVKMRLNLCEAYSEYDTVLMLESDYQAYYDMLKEA